MCVCEHFHCECGVDWSSNIPQPEPVSKPRMTKDVLLVQLITETSKEWLGLPPIFFVDENDKEFRISSPGFSEVDGKIFGVIIEKSELRGYEEGEIDTRLIARAAQRMIAGWHDTFTRQYGKFEIAEMKDLILKASGL